jgi:hypothetical protein
MFNMNYTSADSHHVFNGDMLQNVWDVYYVNFSNVTVTRTLVTRSIRQVKLDIFESLDDDVVEYKTTYPTWLRPDINGAYEVTFTTLLKGVEDSRSCVYQKKALVSVTCGQAPDLSGVPDTIKMQVDRATPTMLTLNASAVLDSDTDSDHLAFQWVLVYPNWVNHTNPLFPDDSSYDYHVPVFQYETTNFTTQSIVTMQVLDAGLDYVFNLTVSDGCNRVSKRVTVHLECNVALKTDPTHLITTFDGSIPVTMMTMAYDYHTEIASALPYPACQSYRWSELEYTSEIPADYITSGSTDFVKTAGFAGLIAAIVIVGVTVPVILYLYFSKKACFKSSDPRV